MVNTEPPLNRVIALFCLYTFYKTQPCTEAPCLHLLKHIEIPIDLYTSIMILPQTLTAHLTPLQPHAIYILSYLVKAQIFYIIPTSTLHAFNPRELPREIFIQDGYELSTLVDEWQLISNPSQGSESTKKKGRPTKRDKKKKAMHALHQVDKWLEKNTITIQPPPYPVSGQMAFREADKSIASLTPITTHVLMSHPPVTTLNNYRAQKSQLLGAINQHGGETSVQEALTRANLAVLARMKKLDQMAAEKGLEVGGEGGDRTGLGRVEKAVAELYRDDVTAGHRGGILGLLEGSGMESERIQQNDGPSTLNP